METRNLGGSDLDLTVVGLGTWAIGGGDWLMAWGPQDEAESARTIHEALNLGINWIDTAPIYGMGTAEEVVGRALLGMATRPLIATKCGRTWTSDRQITKHLNRASILHECEMSLTRLGVDVIDLYQIHWPEPDADIEEAWATLRDLQDQGKIRFGGVSNFNAEQMARLHFQHPIASLQPPYSMLKRAVEESILPWCADHGVGVIAYSPMQKGLLTGRFDAARLAALPDDDHRQRDPMFSEDGLAHAARIVEMLRAVGTRHDDASPAQIAIAWVLNQPSITAAIVGARKPGQLAETVGAADITLTPEDLTDLDAVL
ncbi:MAG: aldo/keto reductase [Planctomycetes bacterium]|nr:aldo/keto reductase [Planctomycetota bacterium]